ncbi:MAG: zinc-dependent metalloprotease [Saprospiraceae bacterium]
MKKFFFTIFSTGYKSIPQNSRTCLAGGGGGRGPAAKKLPLICKSAFFLLFFLVSFIKSEAQSTTSFLYPSLVTANNLSTSQEFKRQKLLAQPTSKSVQLVQLNNLLPMLSNGQLPIMLPNTSKTHTFATNYIRTYPNGDYTWFGELSSVEYCENGTTVNECFDGSFMAIMQDGQTFSELWLDTSYYQIRDLGEGVSALVEIDTDEIVGGCATPSDTPFSGEGEQGAGERDDPPLCPVRVLVLFTEAALETNPDIVGLANAGIATTKVALTRSEVNENQLSVTLAGVQALTNAEWVESGDIDVDRFSLAGNTAITGFRTQFNADLVFILTAGGYDNATGAIVTFGDSPADAATAFAIVEANAVTAPQYTFAHEFGHLFGARHEGTDLCASDGDDTGLQDAHGYRFHKWCDCLIVQRKDYYTVMSTNCRNGSAVRIQNYSNPDVEYKNKDTGREGKNNNAKVLREATCRISNYAVSNDVYVRISGEDHGCPNTVVALLATISGNEPLGAYTLRWESSYDWITWFNVLEGSGLNFTNYNVIVPANAGDKITIRLTLTTPSGNQFFAWYEVESVDNGGRPQQRPARNRSDLLAQGDISISPNPNSGVMTLTVNNAKGNFVGFSIINSFGQTIYEHPCSNTDVDDFQAAINLPNMAQGFYWVKVKNGEKATSAKVFVAN